MCRVASAAASTDTGLDLSASYTYTDDLLTKIQTPSTAYSFTYGDFALRTNVKAGDRTLATYSYADITKLLTTLDYGNGDKVNYTYDTKGRLLTQTYEDGDRVTYKYDNNGALATVTDSATGITTTYYYDFTDRMVRYVESGTNYSHTVGYEYDSINNLTTQVETINGEDRSTSYTYDAWGNQLSCTGSMATTLGTLNPLRYRGYVYDQEAELYYLQSRYYDPNIGRFLNADGTMAGVGENMQGSNVFAYSFNNPVNLVDITGEWPNLFPKLRTIIKFMCHAKCCSTGRHRFTVPLLQEVEARIQRKY